MPDVISDYQKWKHQGDSLRVQAKQAMEVRYRELLQEAAAIAEEYRLDFGGSLKPPSPVTAFRYKAPGKPKGKKAAKPPVAKAAPRVEPRPPEVDLKSKRLQKQLETARQKLEGAKSAGKPTRVLEDRIYEIEDALRLAATPAR